MAAGRTNAGGSGSNYVVTVKNVWSSGNPPLIREVLPENVKICAFSGTMNNTSWQFAGIILDGELMGVTDTNARYTISYNAVSRTLTIEFNSLNSAGVYGTLINLS